MAVVLRSGSHGERGAALLAFMLVLIVGAATMLTSRLNEYAQAYARGTETQLALAEAKRALIRYAMNYPEFYTGEIARGPGFLPCPDQNDDGITQANCADSTGSTLGRLPHDTLGLTPLRDSSGELLWYGVSQDFKYNQSAGYILNSERPGTISVDGTDDIVAVIIAPGAPVSGQSGRRNATEDAALLAGSVYAVAGQYLENENASATNASFVSSAAGEFNDQVLTITRAELMQAVEQRVLSEARAALANFRSESGTYPWLAVFADPKSAPRWLKGTHSGGDGSATLVDTSVDFLEWGVSSGDRVWNLSNGASGTVNVPSATSLTLTGFGFGNREIPGGFEPENDFDPDDEYYIEVRGLSDAFRGTAGAGSSTLTLRDTGKDFEQLNVVAGDVVDVTDGSSWATARSSGLIESVSGTDITVSGLSGSADNSFDSGDQYRVRSGAGRASASLSLALRDSSADFVTSGVQVGDLIYNLSDGSIGTVASGGVTATQLTLSSLRMGTENDFDVNDAYTLTRFSGNAGVREGLLPVHEPGAAFISGFTIDWSLLESDGNTQVADTFANEYSGTYRAALYNWTQSSTHAGAITVDAADARCIWLSAAIAACKGQFEIDDFLSGTVSASTTSTLSDSSQDFSSAGAGIKRGDRVFNTSDGTEGIVRAQSTATQLTVSNITGMSSLNKATGQPYRVRAATDSLSGTAQSPTSTSALRLYAGAGTFVGVIEPGDVMENTNFSAIGRVTNVGYSSFYNRDYVDFTSLQHGSYPDIIAGEGYRIYYNYVDRRVYEFDLRISGDFATSAAAGLRTRTVCVGYDPDALSGPCTVPLSPVPQYLGDGTTSIVTLRDYDEDDLAVGQSSVRIPAGGTPTPLIRVSGLNYQLDDSADELPAWFIKNRWHHLVYAAYSAAYAPGTAGSCPANGACLQLQAPFTTFTDRQALVAVAGRPLNAAQAAQRAAAALGGYYENANAVSGNDTFVRAMLSDAFNDQVAVICPDQNNPACP